MSADVALAPLLLGSWPTSLEAAPQALAAGVTTVITTGGPHTRRAAKIIGHSELLARWAKADITPSSAYGAPFCVCSALSMSSATTTPTK